MSPSVIIYDFETALTDGTPSVEFYRDDFRAISCAFAWREGDKVKTRYVVGERAMRRDFERLLASGVPLAAHNLQYDLAVLMHRFPGLDYTGAKVCTMRLSHNAYARKGFSQGLVSVAAHWLPIEYHDHKAPFHALIRERGGKRGKEGSELNLLTVEELRAYNVRDVEVTLALYERLLEFFNDINFDWTIDHELFRENLPFIIEAEARGILVDRCKAQQAVTSFTDEVTGIERGFIERFSEPISEVEEQLRDKLVGVYKTDKGRLSAALRAPKFSIYNPHHLKRLLVDVMGLVPTFLTKKGNATFGSKLLWSFGEPGKMLDKKGRLKINTDQATALLENSERDGRWHHKIKAVGTVSDRYAGGEHEST